MEWLAVLIAQDRMDVIGQSACLIQRTTVVMEVAQPHPKLFDVLVIARETDIPPREHGNGLVEWHMGHYLCLYLLPTIAYQTAAAIEETLIIFR
jgi:hypothetical protein